jgi:hypothetical protein
MATIDSTLGRRQCTAVDAGGLGEFGLVHVRAREHLAQALLEPWQDVTAVKGIRHR